MSRGANRRPLLGIECQSVVNEMLGMSNGRAGGRSRSLEVLPARKCGNDIFGALAELKKLKFSADRESLYFYEPEIL